MSGRRSFGKGVFLDALKLGAGCGHVFGLLCGLKIYTAGPDVVR